jgi:alkylation response protein AidB-like acyl-CoA dehydrogenase
MGELAEHLRSLQEISLPLPGGGKTPERHRALMAFGYRDLSLARIAEAHTDAAAILAEAGHRASAGHLYGVWAADGPHGRLTATRLAGGGWRLDGSKQFCSGTRFVTAALVTAHADDGVYLFDIRLDDPAIRPTLSTWATTAMADTATGPVEFVAATVAANAVVGDRNWYLRRPGFWHGAIGPAACWAGGAQFLAATACNVSRSDAHSRAHQGALHAIAWGLGAVLDQAGREIDAAPRASAEVARIRALEVRHLVERWCTEVMDRVGRATGPHLLCFDAAFARQFSALTVYIRQCHAERDLETIQPATASV